jgi:hypothetical protein
MKIKVKLSLIVIAIVTVNNVNEISARNREGIENLIQEVARFKVE